MIKMGLFLSVLFISSSAFAQGKLNSTVKEVTAEYKAMGLIPDFLPTPTPAPSATPTPINPTDINPSFPTDINTNSDGISIDQMIAIGTKVWDFIISNKPNAEYEVFKTSVVPAGITSWGQLQKWSKPVSKVYRVEFTNMFGQPAGGFDYRITYFYNGSYKGKGKFLGQISVVPTNIHLYTDRSLKMKVELASVINFGTEEDPIAGAQVIINWNSPTTTRYEMYSAEYLIYGTGEIEDLSNGN
jgi:hypothetical protein